MITFNSGCSGAVVENSQLPEHLPWSHRAQLLAFLSHLDATVWTAEETKPSLNAWNNRSIITSKNVLYRNISSGHCRQYRYHMYQYWRQCPELNQERCTKSSPLFHIIVQRSILPVTPAPHCCSTIYSGKPLIYYTGPLHHHSQTNYYYCYSHYVGLPAKRLSCLQRAMHSAALLSWRIPKVEYVTSYIRWMSFTGYPYNSESLNEFQLHALVSLKSMFVTSVSLPWVHRASLSSQSTDHGVLILHTHQLSRITPSQSLVPRSIMDYIL